MVNKMNWLVDQHLNHTEKYIIRDLTKGMHKETCPDKGTIVIPTGGGKSAVIYNDIISHIKTAGPTDKMIFNISAPLLSLEGQIIKDLFEVLKGINVIDTAKDVRFYINSSDQNIDRYGLKKVGIDAESFENIETFFNIPQRFAIVASCHPSLKKFADKLPLINSHPVVVTNYFDEAHLLIHETRDDVKNIEDATKQEKERIDTLSTILEGSKRVYALTATPDKFVTARINGVDKNVDYDVVCENSLYTNISNFYIYEEFAKDLIQNNVIMPVSPHQLMVDNDEIKNAPWGHISPSICIDFLNMVRAKNPNINHKVLVTCESSTTLQVLEEALRTYRIENNEIFNIYSTCAKNGSKTSNGDEEFTSVAEEDFVKEVDVFDGDCFVLHIKKLRQGIDIKTLTDCIYYNSARVNDGVKRTIVQTVGRVIRAYAGERGMDINDRKKKYGEVLFVIGKDDFEAVSRQISTWLITYYGVEGVKGMSNDTNKDNGDTGKKHGDRVGDVPGDTRDEMVSQFIDAMRLDLIAFINATVKPCIDQMKMRLGEEELDKIASNKKFFAQQVDNLKVKYHEFLTKTEGPTFADIIVNDVLINDMNHILRPYFKNIPLW